MDKGLKELLEGGVLSDETKTALSEAWNSKLDEMRASLLEEAETRLREEFASRFAKDKSELVEAMDRMLSDAIKVNAEQTAVELKALKEERTRLTSTITEARADYKAKIASNTRVLENFALKALTTELKEFAEDREELRAEKIKVAEEAAALETKYEAKLAEDTVRLQESVVAKLSEQVAELKAQKKALEETEIRVSNSLNEHRAELNEQTKKAMLALENFVVKQLTKELKEFNQDKKALAEARARFAIESKTKLAEQSSAFIDRATRIVDTTVESVLRKELGQLKGDLKEARQNILGRRVFEAFKSEYMAGGYSDSSELKDLNRKLKVASAQIAEAKAATAEKAALIESMERRLKQSEERALRERTLNNLLSPLNNEKRALMSELLEGVKTPALKVYFNKYLPTILNESDRGSSQKGRQLLSETPVTAKRPVNVVTGDRNNRLTESARAEVVENQEEIHTLRRLAGIEE